MYFSFRQNYEEMVEEKYNELVDDLERMEYDFLSLIDDGDLWEMAEDIVQGMYEQYMDSKYEEMKDERRENNG